MTRGFKCVRPSTSSGRTDFIIFLMALTALGSFFTITGVILTGCGGGDRGTVVNPVDLSAPESPDPFYVTVEYDKSDFSVTLNWKAPTVTNGGDAIADPQLLQYRVFRSDNSGPWESIGQTAATVFQDADEIISGGAYSYYVKAIDSQGREGDRSEILQALPRLVTGPTFRGNIANTGRTTETVTLPLDTKWLFTNNSIPLTSSPVVARGKVFIGDAAGFLIAINAATGQEIWRRATGGGIASSPTVADGKVIFGSADYNVYALDAATGAEIWESAARDMVSGAPKAAYGMVFIGVGDPTSDSPSDTRLYALDLLTGVKVWEFETQGAVASCPAAARGVVYFGSTDHNVYAVDAFTGEEIWRYPTGGKVIASPAVMNGKVYIGSMDDYLYAIDTQPGPGGAGVRVWEYRTLGNIGLSAVVDGNRVYFGSANSSTATENKLIAVDAAGSQASGTTTLIWSDPTPDGNQPWASPTIANGALIAGTGSPTIFHADERVYIMAPDGDGAGGGVLLWQRQLGAPLLSPVYVDGVLYAATVGGTLTAFE